MRWITVVVLFAAAVSRADTISAVETIYTREDADTVAYLSYSYGISTDRLTFSGLANAGGTVTISVPTYEDWLRDPRAETYVIITAELTTLGPVRSGFIDYAVSRSGDGSGESIGYSTAYVDQFYPSNITPRDGRASGVMPFTLGQEFYTGITAHGFAHLDGGAMSSASVWFRLYEADGVTPAPIYWVSEVPEPGTLTLLLLAIVYQGLVSLDRIATPSIVRKYISLLIFM
jgi:hypothetical protein